jgi:hypothetical protein
MGSAGLDFHFLFFVGLHNIPPIGFGAWVESRNQLFFVLSTLRMLLFWLRTKASPSRLPIASLAFRGCWEASRAFLPKRKYALGARG